MNILDKFATINPGKLKIKLLEWLIIIVLIVKFSTEINDVAILIKYNLKSLINVVE